MASGIDRLAEQYELDAAQVRFLERCARLYERVGLIDHDGNPRRLSEACPCAGCCWQGDRREQAPAPHQDQVALPWVGARYAAERIAVVGMNFDRWGGLDAHWQVCRSHIEALQSGRSGKAGRPFALRAMTCVRAIADSRLGVKSESPPPAPESLAADWQRCVFLQAIKCAPLRPRSEPYPEMFSACPPLLLLDELHALAPTVVVLFGRSRVRDVVRPMLEAHADLRWGEHRGAMERDVATIAGAPATILSMNHPSSRGSAWEASFGQLQHSLADTPA